MGEADRRSGQPESPPARIWRALGLAAVLLLLLSTGIIAFVSSGALDPLPAGPPLVTVNPGVAYIGGGEIRRDWLAEMPAAGAAARLTAAYVEGEVDSGYGLTLGEESGYLVAAVAPTGYAAVWQQQGAEQTALFPWQPWPHVDSTGPNTIQAEAGAGTVTIRINGELLWQGSVEVSIDQAGIFLESFGAGTAVDFHALAIYPATARE